MGQPEILVEFARTANPALILEKIKANYPKKTRAAA